MRRRVIDTRSSTTDGTGAMPVRTVFKLPIEPKFGVLAAMPSSLGEHCACKAITVFPSNAHTPLSSHQGSILLFSTADGRLLSLTDAHEVTRLRTAAASAVATRALARPDACTLALLGTGAQAEALGPARRRDAPLGSLGFCAGTPS